MEPNINPDKYAEERRIIQEAIKSGENAAAQQRLAFEQDFIEPEEELEIPEELEDPGEHTLREMSSLARIGKGTKGFDYRGHYLMVRTLTQGEELEILARINGFPPTAQARAYNVYAAALALESVNGKPYFEKLPLGPNQDMISYRFRKIQELYPETINAIVNEVYALRSEIEQKSNYAKKE